MKLPGLLKDTPFLSGVFVGREWLDWFQTLGSTYPTVVLSSSADRGNQSASRLAIGSRLVLQDWGTTYEVRQVDGSPQWVYAYGTYRAALSSKPSTLGVNDTGFLFYATDYYRLFRWTGSAWAYGDGEQPAKAIILYPGTLPSGYALCDGSAVTVTLSDATTTSFTTPDLTGQFVKGGIYTGSVVAAVAPGLTGRTEAVSAGTPSGTNDAPTFTGSPGTTSNSGSGTVASGAGASASGNHSHTFTPSGTVSAPNFTGDALATHDHGKGTLAVDATGEPAHVLLLPVVKL